MKLFEEQKELEKAYMEMVEETVKQLLHIHQENYAEVIESVENLLQASGANAFARTDIESAKAARKKIGDMLIWRCEKQTDTKHLGLITDLVSAIAADESSIRNSVKLEWKMLYFQNNERLVIERCLNKQACFGGLANDYIPEVLDEAYNEEHGDEAPVLFT